MSYVLQISIGRDQTTTTYDERDFYQDGPGTRTTVSLPDPLWADFKEIIARSLKHQAEHQDTEHNKAYFVTIHEGEGVWEGMRETSAIITLVSEHEVTLSEDARNGLAYLATQYGQQAIAITKGESFLVEAK